VGRWTLCRRRLFLPPRARSPELLSVQPATNGFRLTASGTPGWTYAILSSTNLTTNISLWPRIATAPADASGHIVFTDTNITLPQRFYRGVNH